MPGPNAGRANPERPGTRNRPEQSRSAWLRARARVVPGALHRSPPWVRSVFDHAWAPMVALSRQVGCLPPELCETLLHCEGGFIAIDAGDSHYVPGPATIRDRPVRNVAFISVCDLAQDNERPLHVIGHLIDHHLGCRGEAEGAWLSEGGGILPRWQEAGTRLARLFALGYAVDEIAQANGRDYFAQSLALYCRERQRLNVADPQIDKWFRTTLWEAGFWLAEPGNEGGR